MEPQYETLQKSLITIASELFRFQRVYEKAMSRLELEEQAKYISQFTWFSKKVLKALGESGFRIINVEGQLYDPGMAVAPINIDEFEPNDQLYVLQSIEPIIMLDDTVYKTGTVILGRVE